MDLTDVCNAFVQTKACSDEESMRVKLDEAELDKYEFGTII